MAVQLRALAQAHQIMNTISRSGWELIEDAQRRLPPIPLGVLVFWLALLFLSFGLFAPRNRIVFLTLIVSACSMAVAIFLVLEMNSPLDGLMKISSALRSGALELTRFRGHWSPMRGGVHDAQEPTTVPARVPAADQ